MAWSKGCTIVGVREGVVTHIDDGRRAQQPHRRHHAARDHDGRDVDGHRSPATRCSAPRGSASSASTTRSARSSTTRSSGTTRRRRTATRPGTASRSRRTTSRRASLHHNTVVASPGGVAAFDHSTIERLMPAVFQLDRAHGPPELPRPALGRAARGVDLDAHRHPDPRHQPPRRALRRVRRRCSTR